MNYQIGLYNFKLRCRDPWTARSVCFFLIGVQGSMDHQIGPYFKIEMQGSMDYQIDPLFFHRDAGIHEPPNRSEFLNWSAGIHGPQIGPYF